MKHTKVFNVSENNSTGIKEEKDSGNMEITTVRIEYKQRNKKSTIK